MAEPFRIQSERTNGVTASVSHSTGNYRPTNSSGQSVIPTFADALAQTQDVHFSNHAQKRMESRDIQLSEENVNRLSGAIDKAEKRGGKNSLVLVDDLAFIVNVRDRLVVTAMNAEQRGEGVFTQIDSVVFADPAEQAVRSQIDHQA
jgi:flagellar operon protein